MAEVAERSTVVEVLEAAKERITPVERWTQGWFAKDALGNRITASNPEAVCWCAAGSIYAEEGRSSERDFGLYPEAGPDALGFLITAAKPRLVAVINDEGGHAAVLALYDRAIQLAEQEAPDA